MTRGEEVKKLVAAADAVDAARRYQQHAREVEAVVRRICADPSFEMPKWTELSPALQRHWRVAA